MSNPFYVQPALATQGAMQGLGQLAQAGGQYFADQHQAEQQGQNTQAFMTLVNQSDAAHDPEEKKRLMTQAFVQFPDQAKQLRQQTALMREQAELELVKRAPEKEQAEIDAKKLDGELKQEKDKFEQSKKLRDEYNKASSDFFKVRDAYGRVQASIEDPDAAGDIALIFNYMKMLDPGSVVREGEFATAQNAGGVDKSVLNMYNKLRSGERLQPEQRTMFSSRAGKLFNKAQGQNKKDKGKVLSIGRRYKLSKDDIFGGPVESTEQETVQADDKGVAYTEGMTATNPQTGEKVQYRGGKWLPM